ncbi:MAG: cation transporter [Candidatus Niyogibacteria bacterium]|nr:cation transporter [Candidatus Niyogibacteria bacterium]
MIHSQNCLRTGSCWCEVKRYGLILAVGALILAGELAGGYLSGSLALMADAFHVAIDGGAVVIAIAIAVSVRKRPEREALMIRRKGTGIQAALMIVIVVGIVSEALRRLEHPVEIQSMTMLGTAILGAVGNYIQHWMLRKTEAGDDANITRRALDRHILSDLAQSIAVIAGGIVIAVTGWFWVDPLLSLGVAALMGYWAIHIIRDGAEPHHHP